MDPITLATLILSQTGLGSWIKDKMNGAVSAPVADKIIAVAQAAIGSPITEPDKLTEAQQLAISDKLTDNAQEILRLQFADLASARSMYISTQHEMADGIAKTIMRYNLPAITLLLVANCLIVYYIKDAAIALAVGNLIGGTISYLWQERTALVGFYFGSSIGSKTKGGSK